MSTVREVEAILSSFLLTISKRRRANGRQNLRLQIDEAFSKAGGWTKAVTGTVDWTKRRLGVEVQVSAHYCMISLDLLHLKEQYDLGRIDAGMIIVIDPSLACYLTRGAADWNWALRLIEPWVEHALPLRLVSIAHDAVGAPLPKQINVRGPLAGGKAQQPSSAMTVDLFGNLNGQPYSSSTM